MKKSERPPNEVIPTWVSHMSPQLRVMATPHAALQLSLFQLEERLLRFSLLSNNLGQVTVSVCLSIK